MSEQRNYPPEAYCPDDGKLWWDRGTADGPVGASGSVPRMASWLRWNVEIGQRFSTRELRNVLGIAHEHFQRRQRELRELGWTYLSAKEDPSLGEECELLGYGWWPGEGPRPRKSTISSKLRRQVFERDGSRCVICGRAAGEKYEDGGVVVLTAGHIIAHSHGGSATLDNLQTECRRCNESARADTGTAADPKAVCESVKSLRFAERMELLEWLKRGSRTRTQLDRVYDSVRLGGPAVREAVMSYLLEASKRHYQRTPPSEEG